MDNLLFSELSLSPETKKAIDEMGFDIATGIQSQAIPLIRMGKDIIGRSQTGTGKTMAFAIPAIEKIDFEEVKPTLQVLILCPTRELAQQAFDEISKLTKYQPKVHAVDVYGGASMDRQIISLRRANLVIGTPGRIMDHMRRRTIKFDNLKMVVLDEADEMLSMGFKEDIETILTDAPEDRQTVLFSATMPSEILKLTKEFQKDPQLIEINKAQVTLDKIEQYYIDAPMGRKMDALNILLRYYSPNRALIFCNTKHMVDEITEYLTVNKFNAEGLHGDMKQAQRTKTMDSFKNGHIPILVATDVAARGIDVNDIDYVINFDLPQNNEYYIHRIGRTGRAGKSGIAITICSGRRQVCVLNNIAHAVKSEINTMKIPSAAEINAKSGERQILFIKEALNTEVNQRYINMVTELSENGYSPEAIAATLLQLHFGVQDIKEIKVETVTRQNTGVMSGEYQKIMIDIGRSCRIAPKHLVSAIAERAGLQGKEIGKIEIFDEYSVVAVPSAKISTVLEDMKGCKICGRPTKTTILVQKQRSYNRDYHKNDRVVKKNSDYRHKPVEK